MNVPTRRIRVAHLVTHPIQYFAPLYRNLSERPEIDLTVYFYSMDSLRQHLEPDFGRVVEWDTQLIGGYKHLALGDAPSLPLSRRNSSKPNWAMLRHLIRQDYDIIWIHGYANGNAWAATLLGRILRIPVLLRDDQTHFTPRPAIKRWVKQFILPRLFKHVTGLFVGSKNRDFFRSYGTTHLYPVSHCVDNSYFQKRHAELLPERAASRAHFGISDEWPVVLFSGKFIDKKKPLLLLEAFRPVRDEFKCHLLLVGDGQLREQLAAQVKLHSTPDVHFAGFLNQSEISSAYSAADLLVLPSAYLETWGLVVNEAMNFNLPVIVSDHVGCSGDLVRDGVNGFVFPSGDVAALTSALRKVVASPVIRSQFGQRSRELISDYSIDAVTEQAVHALVSAAGIPQHALRGLVSAMHT